MQKNFKVLFVIFYLLVSVIQLSGQSLIINEFMSDNQSTIHDYDGDYSDWIEIYNYGDFPINLRRFNLTDDFNDYGKWKFPEIIIQPHSFILVFASGKDVSNIDQLHTNFKIDKAGEKLILCSNNYKVLSVIEPVELLTDQSYGSINDGSSILVSFDSPTPGLSNAGSNNIHCSSPSGFYPHQINVILTLSNQNHNIYYTLNGDIPTSNSNLYNSSIVISDLKDSPYNFSSIPTTPLNGPSHLMDFIWKEPKDVYKANVLRYASFDGDDIKSDVYSKTYFIDPEIENRYSFPIVSIVTDSLNLFDYDTGIYIPGKVFDETGFNWWPIGNYHQRGSDWERDIHISYFENNGHLGFETDAGMRMRGYGSTSNPQKSFGVYFRDDYGKSMIEYPIFKGSENKSYKRLIFRNSGNDFLYTHFRDALLQQMISSLDLDLQGFRPSIVFINGEYWGIHGIREKIDKHYFNYHYGIDEDNINILGICGDVEEGYNIDYFELVDFLATADMTRPHSYNHIKKEVDIWNFIDAQIAEIYFANYDWPCNNFKMWKTNNPDSKWRFIAYDFDLSYGSDESSEYNTKSLNHATSIESEWPYCDCSNRLLRKLMENEEFKIDFVNRFAYHINNTFKSSTMLDSINAFQTLFIPEIREHIERWNYPSSISQWQIYIGEMREFARKRSCFMKDHIMDYMELTEFNYECPPDTLAYYSKLDIYPNPGKGKFSVHNSSPDVIIGDIYITSISGQVVYYKKDVILLLNEVETLDVEHLPNGTYVLNLVNKGSLERKKLIIIK